jgi:CsoR family transcriptional regulator, copper-sensing transcriptional repressor
MSPPPSSDDTERQQILHRLKRAEGQLRGLQRMIDEGADCLEVAAQLTAVRRALDSTHVRMARCHVQERLLALIDSPTKATALPPILDDLEAMVGKIR